MNSVVIDITSECNLACEYCYMEEEGVLSPEEIDRLAEEHNPRRVEIGGGEPMLHPEITGIVMSLLDSGRDVSIATNGTIVNEALLGTVDGNERGHFQVSLPAADYETWRRVTHGDGMDVVLANSRMLKRRGFSVAYSSAIYSGNYDAVPGIIEVAKEERIPVRFNLVFPVGNGRNVELLTRNQVNKLRSRLLEERIGTGGLIDSPLLHANTCPGLEEAYGLKRAGECPALIGEKIHVSPDGTMHRCEFYRG